MAGQKSQKIIPGSAAAAAACGFVLNTVFLTDWQAECGGEKKAHAVNGNSTLRGAYTHSKAFQENNGFAFFFFLFAQKLRFH